MSDSNESGQIVSKLSWFELLLKLRQQLPSASLTSTSK